MLRPGAVKAYIRQMSFGLLHHEGLEAATCYRHGLPKIKLDPVITAAVILFSRIASKASCKAMPADEQAVLITILITHYLSAFKRRGRNQLT